VFIDDPSEICQILPIVNFDSVDAGEAVWSDGSLCFDGDTSGLYSFEITATNDCGEDACSLFVQVYAGLAPLLVTSTSPARNELNVSTSGNVQVTFDIEADQSTLNDSTFVVNGRSTGIHQGVYTYDVPTRTVTFDPATDFAYGDVVTVLLTTGVKSSGGHPLDSSYAWSYVTDVSDESPCTFMPDSAYESFGFGFNEIVAADLDGDNDLDLAVASPIMSSMGYLSVLLNNGDGVFGPFSHYSVGTASNSICAADLDGDGDLDLATEGRYSDSVSVLLNNGDGVFAPRSAYPAGIEPRSVLSADLDGDGDMDLVTTDRSYPYGISVLLNRGDGSFALPMGYSAGDHPTGLCVGDFDEDGDMDIATANFNPNEVSVILNNGDGSFAPRSYYPVFWELSDVAAADFDGDGHLDLAAVGGPYNGRATIFLGSGDGTFTEHSAAEVGDYPTSVFAGDLDGDGDLDLSVSNLASENTIALNNGDGTFAAATEITTAGNSVVAADLDGDGDLDLATAQYQRVTMHRNMVCVDSDGDGYGDPDHPENECEDDNCPDVYNPDQLDSDGDGTGDACEWICGDADASGQVDIDDAVYLIAFVFSEGPPPAPYESGDTDCSGAVDIDDITFLVAYIFSGGPVPCDVDGDEALDC
jgi:hypothetical protein